MWYTHVAKHGYKRGRRLCRPQRVQSTRQRHPLLCPFSSRGINRRHLMPECCQALKIKAFFVFNSGRKCPFPGVQNVHFVTTIWEIHYLCGFRDLILYKDWSANDAVCTTNKFTSCPTETTKKSARILTKKDAVPHVFWKKDSKKKDAYNETDFSLSCYKHPFLPLLVFNHL